jgi:hypothetical protein
MEKTNFQQTVDLIQALVRGADGMKAAANTPVQNRTPVYRQPAER